MSTHKPSALARFTKRVRTHKIITFLRRQPAISYALAGAVLVLAAYMCMFIIAALSNALLFSGYAADGAFQALNPLRRIVAGEAIGADFNTFHGIGVPLLHLPFYYIFGQGLFASELSRWLLSPALFMLAAYGFYYACNGGKKAAVIATAVITSVAMTTMSLFVLPFTSMLGVRSVMPVLLAMLMFKQAKFKRLLHVKIPWVTRYEVLVALVMVICLACGTEFGVAAIMAFFIAHIAYRVDAKSTVKQRALSSLRIAVLFAALLFIVCSAITRGHPLQALQYAFTDIPADQFWYFGVPPNTFLHLGNIVQTFWNDADLHTYWLYGLVAVIVLVAVHRLKAYRLQSQVFLYAILAGAFAMISMLGYYHNSEAFALARMSLLVIGAGSVLLWRQYVGRPKLELGVTVGRKKIRFTTGQVVIGVALLFMVWGAGQALSVVKATKAQYDVVQVLRKTKAYALGQDANILNETWNQDDSLLMPLIQADNTVVIADINENGFMHGVQNKSRELVVDPGNHTKFVRSGQIVYFAKSGRQIIGSVKKYRDNLLQVTIQNISTQLESQYDGAPQKLVVAEDFTHNNNKLWSTYSTLFESEMGVFNPNSQHADYIIHALGPDLRAKYVNDFSRIQPQYVVTLKKSYFIYEEWLQNTSWDFYSLIDANYEMVKDGTIHVLWKRRDQPWVNPLAQVKDWQMLIYNAADKKLLIPDIDWSRLPDVNAYINTQRQQDADVANQNGNNDQPTLLGPADDVARNKAEHELAKLQSGRPDFEGQGHNTTTKKSNPQDKIPYVELYRPKRAVILVKLQYVTANPLDKIPLIGKTARFFVQPNNLFNRTQVSLAPYRHETVFPIVVSELNHDSSLSLKTYSLLPAKTGITITSAQWQLLDTSAANLMTLTDWPGPDLREP